MFHARWADHAYPVHTHDTWTLLIVDDGVIGYDLDRRRGQVASASGVTLLPPHVPHDGHALTGSGFRKRVVYLDDTYLDPTLAGGLAESARIVGIASTSGVAGNKGQTNYAASAAFLIRGRAIRSDAPSVVNARTTTAAGGLGGILDPFGARGGKWSLKQSDGGEVRVGTGCLGPSVRIPAALALRTLPPARGDSAREYGS